MATPTRTEEHAEQILANVEQKYGFRPNLIQELVEAPAAAEVYLRGQDAMADSSLTPAQQQAVQLTVATYNECHYCGAAHTALGKQSGLDDEDIEAIREGRLPSDSDLEAVVQATLLVLDERGWLDESDRSELERAGVDRQKLYEIIAFVGLKTLSNYVNHIADTDIDPQFS